jgi:hypothetical protein
LYTNEHVVRLGMEHCQNLVMTYPGYLSVGEVVLTSRRDGQNEDDATMECHSQEVNEDVRKQHSFIADWAIAKFEQAPTGPIEIPGKLCSHVNDLIHIPLKGTVIVTGAGRRQRPGEPCTAVYTTEIEGNGLPTVFTPGMWYNNKIEPAC